MGMCDINIKKQRKRYCNSFKIKTIYMDFLQSLPTLDSGSRAAVNGVLQKCGRFVLLRSGQQSYPFGNPVSAERLHLDYVRKQEYLVTDKSDGVRGCFVCCETDTTFVSAFVDRRCNMYGIAVDADEGLYNGTVLDAEIVQSGDGRIFVLVFDTCAIGGIPDVQTESLQRRLQFARDIVLPNCSFKRPEIALHVKQMFSVSDKESMTKMKQHVSSLEYDTDGYILTPAYDGASTPGKADRIIKLKDDHTLDFMWSNDMLWFGDESEFFPATYVHLTFETRQLRNIAPGTIVEMVPQKDKANNVVMMHFAQERPDKDCPNSYLTVTRTLVSIKDAVTLDAIVEAAMNSRS